jgi:hypothetical protein
MKKRNVEHFYERSLNVTVTFSVRNKRFTVVKKEKCKNITPENIGAIFLCQIPLVHSVSAVAIMQKFSSFQELINSCNNPELIDRTLAPNGNTIYKIYSDGEITFEKGGDAYGRRTLHTLMSSCIRNKFADLFPFKITGSYNDDYGYAIVTCEDAYKIRDALINLHNKK